MKNQKRSRNPVRPLPDDVVMDILSRLPADDLLKFRRVCRTWKALISTQYFAELHLKSKHSSLPTILVQESLPELLLLDKWVPPRKRVLIRKVHLDFIPYSCTLLNLSCDGFIVVDGYNGIQRSRDFIIFNPITGEKVTIHSQNFNLLGLFFNPFIKEYCCIFWELLKNLQFSMLNLGAHPCCRALKYPTPFIHKPRDSSRDPPVVIDDAILYWLVRHRVSSSGDKDVEFPSCEELILAFDIKTEEFSVMSHPGPTCHHPNHLNNMHILKMDGRLSFVQTTFTSLSFIIDIWTLKDSANGLWTKNYSVSISIDQFDSNIGVWTFGLMATGNGELLLWLPYIDERIYACNLELGSVRRIGRKCRRPFMSTFVPSFVSLGNCKSEIWI